MGVAGASNAKLTVSALPRRRAGDRRPISRPWRTVIGAVLVTIVVIAGWQIALSATGASSYITKTPLDVIRYLFDDSYQADGTAADRRATVLSLVGVTLGHAAVGLGVGVGAGVVIAIMLAASRTLRSMFLPAAIFLQTVPLIALAPVIYAVFGGGILTAAVIAGIVTFFPLLVNLLTGFETVSVSVRDVIAVYGGSRNTVIRLAAIPAALPYLFAGLRLAVPTTIGGAMLYEFLFTFEGLGATMKTARQYSDYGLMWTVVAVSLLLAIAAYALVALAERLVLDRRFPPPGGAR